MKSILDLIKLEMRQRNWRPSYYRLLVFSVVCETFLAVRGFLPSFFPIMARRKENDRPHQSNNEDSDSNSNEDYEEEPDFEDPEDYVDDISEQGMCVCDPYGQLTPTTWPGLLLF